MNLSLKEINEKIRQSPAKFVEEEDKKYHDRIVTAADLISEHSAVCPIVLLSGPSGSGKTTTAKKVEDELRRRGINTYTVSMDDYFKTMNYKTAPRTATGDIDFESPELLDMELLNEHFTKLERGEEIHVPYFMFARQKRSASRFTPVRLKENEIIIFEGIHAFNEQITTRHPEAFKLYICAMSNINCGGGEVFLNTWTRLVRRVVRDSKFRGADADFTLQMWSNVLDGEKKHIYPYVPGADIQINSSLGYEMPVLKKYAVPLFEKLPEELENVAEVNRVLELLRLFDDVDDSLVADNSLIREFIGGGIYTD